MSIFSVRFFLFASLVAASAPAQASEPVIKLFGPYASAFLRNAIEAHEGTPLEPLEGTSVCAFRFIRPDLLAPASSDARNDLQCVASGSEREAFSTRPVRLPLASELVDAWGNRFDQDRKSTRMQGPFSVTLFRLLERGVKSASARDPRLVDTPVCDPEGKNCLEIHFYKEQPGSRDGAAFFCSRETEIRRPLTAEELRGLDRLSEEREAVYEYVDRQLAEGARIALPIRCTVL
jgi:hypothetical protein